MARQIHTRWKITGTLKAETPIHVGGMGGNADTDLALAVNGKGNYYIPGTSLTGAFRGWVSKPFDKDELETIDNPINQLWGFQDKQGNGHASFIIIEDAEIDGDPQIEIREGVGIDRYTGAAADKAKYSRAILPKGVTFPLKITLDCGNNGEETELWKLLLDLESGDIRIGAAKTRGLGKVKLENVKIKKHQFNSAQGLFDSLLNQNLKQTWPNLKANIAYQSPAKLDLEINWKPKDPVMVKAEGDGIAVDILPLVSQVDNDVRFVIPGSSIKGVLRAHAERIVRTVCQWDSSGTFLKQVQLSLIDEVFGAASYKRKKKDQTIETGLIGILGVDDCYGTLPMNPDDWADVENAPKDQRKIAGRLVQTDELTELKGRLATALQIDETEAFKKLQPAMHVAIDRWTGGAADGMLYSVLEPIGVEWEPIGIHLDLARLEKYHFDLLQPAIALLLLVLRDFAKRKIPIGYGTNRGMGTVEVKTMTAIGSSIEDLAQLNGEHPIANDLSNLDSRLLKQLTKEWTTWIDRQNSDNTTSEEIPA